VPDEGKELEKGAQKQFLRPQRQGYFKMRKENLGNASWGKMLRLKR
jgi:hypothetical protein